MMRVKDQPHRTIMAGLRRMPVLLASGNILHLVLLFVANLEKTNAFQVPARSCCSHSTRSITRRRKSAVPIDAGSESIVAKKKQETSSSLSDVAVWHRERRRNMIEQYGDQIAPLERDASSQSIGLPLLLTANVSLFGLSILSGSLPIWAVVLLAIFPGSMFSLWQLQILHDVVHGSFLDKKLTSFAGMPRKKIQDRLLFWGSMPSIFGYYLYLKFGHLSHHKNAGDADLAQLFESDQRDFEDGDILFVAHRMHLTGETGPKIPLPGTDEKAELSISKTGFRGWRKGGSLWNSVVFATSFLYERLLLGINDVFVSLLGKNLFFPNKPASFQDDCTAYARWATAVRAGLWLVAGWKSLLFLFLSETLWSLPPHPACAMFVTNHGSGKDETGACLPTSSTYAGAWYSIFTLGTNYHCEHHDFPTIPFDKLHLLRRIAPEYYKDGSNDNLLSIIDKTFAEPEFYACMDAGGLLADSRREKPKGADVAR
jgi:fatty acid desaturase